MDPIESALAELESGTAVSFASGMAAVAGVFGSTLKRGDILVMPSDSYYTARLLADGFFSNIEVHIGRRFKRQGRSWTRNGAEHLAQLLWL